MIRYNPGVGPFPQNWLSIDNGPLVVNEIEQQQITLFNNYYKAEDEERQKEIDETLNHNLCNINIDKIVILTEDATPQRDLEIIKLDHRPTYSDFFEIAHKYSGIKIIANSDIYFDESLKLIKNADLTNIVLCITRWDWVRDRFVEILNYGSNDTWVFTDVKINANWTMGRLGCDSLVAMALHKVGYKLYNPAMVLKTYHNHKSNLRTSDCGKPPFALDSDKVAGVKFTGIIK